MGEQAALPFQATRAPPTSFLAKDEQTISLSFPTHDGSQAGLIAQVTFTSPKNLNALRSVDVQLLISILEWINEQPTVLVTVLTGTGRFFSAGANIADPARTLPEEVTTLPDTDPRHITAKRQFFASRAHMNNSRLATAFYRHDKLLVAALNGPVVGISAAVIAYADLLYCFDDFWLLTPFTSLALVAEGGTSATFVRKMGLGRAQQALLEGKKMLAKDLLDSGFISAVFPLPAPPAGTDKKTYTPPIMDYVLPHLTAKLLPPMADSFALLFTKNLIRNATYESKSWVEVNEAEIRGAEAVFTSGRPAKQFERLASGGRHNL